jgi:hypothetical protein
MAKRPVAFIGFRFEPVSAAVLFDDPSGSVKTGRLNLVIWRRKANGQAEESEVHPLGEGSAQELEGLLKELKRDLDRAADHGREWFGAPKPFWR